MEIRTRSRLKGGSIGGEHEQEGLDSEQDIGLFLKRKCH